MFGWKQDPTQAERRDTTDDATGQPCPGLVKAVERVLRTERPQILDLGPLCGNTVIELAGRGARVTVEEFDPPPPPTEEDADPETPLPPLRIEQPGSKFDLVLAWEHIDFVSPDRLAEFAAELRRVTAESGAVLLLSRSTGQGEPERRARYRIVGEDRIVRELVDEEARPRWVHPTRQIELALEGFSIQGVHLQRDQTREYLIVKQDGSARSKSRSGVTGRPLTRRPPAGRTTGKPGTRSSRTRS